MKIKNLKVIPETLATVYTRVLVENKNSLININSYFLIDGEKYINYRNINKISNEINIKLFSNMFFLCM